MEQTFGDKLKQVRTNRGLKQSELAKHLEIGRASCRERV